VLTSLRSWWIWFLTSSPITGAVNGGEHERWPSFPGYVFDQGDGWRKKEARQKRGRRRNSNNVTRTTPGAQKPPQHGPKTGHQDRKQMRWQEKTSIRNVPGASGRRWRLQWTGRGVTKDLGSPNGRTVLEGGIHMWTRVARRCHRLTLLVIELRLVRRTFVALERKLRHGLLCDRQMAWPIVDGRAEGQCSTQRFRAAWVTLIDVAYINSPCLCPGAAWKRAATAGGGVGEPRAAGACARRSTVEPAKAGMAG